MKILVIRRDNIGDLVCTTPLIRSLRERFPEARIDALVNSYNAPVLTHNPNLDHVYAYTKAKHRGDGETAVSVYWRRLKLMAALRSERYDIVILANGGYLHRPLRLARWIAPRSIIGFVPPGVVNTGIDLGVPIDRKPRHEVENIFRLLKPLGVDGVPPPLQLAAAPEERERALGRLVGESWFDRQQIKVAIHISARKVRQRWPAARFAELMRRLHRKIGCQFLLFWSPGDENNPLHPGDDGKAALILVETAGLPVLPYPTERLDELIGGLSVCQAMICSDGGAMHIGAALGLPIVCFFGNSDPCTWRPWGVPHELLQMPSQDVNDISVDEALDAFVRLVSGWGLRQDLSGSLGREVASVEADVSSKHYAV